MPAPEVLMDKDTHDLIKLQTARKLNDEKMTDLQTANDDISAMIDEILERRANDKSNG